MDNITDALQKCDSFQAMFALVCGPAKCKCCTTTMTVVVYRPRAVPRLARLSKVFSSQGKRP